MAGSAQDMKRLTEGLPTKSAKIRALGAAGYKRQEIADFLGTSYQHVRNVLVAAEKKALKSQSGFSEERTPPPIPPLRRSITDAEIHPDGSLTLPKEILSAAGFSPGDVVVIRVLGEGEIELLSSVAALRRAQELVRQSIPDDVDLVEELLKERRREVEMEQREYDEWSKK
jgi:bifunctional DNA-binding transcriptional regulator/antitoxin component of YhaV-PrlF toxin-antitoxin module